LARSGTDFSHVTGELRWAIGDRAGNHYQGTDAQGRQKRFHCVPPCGVCAYSTGLTQKAQEELLAEMKHPADGTAG
jgi:hypothetical protein